MTESSGREGMSDLEMTKLCAQAMGYEIVDDFADVRPPMREVDVMPHGTDASFAIRGEPLRYAPLHDDAQCFALVKRFNLGIQWLGKKAVSAEKESIYQMYEEFSCPYCGQMEGEPCPYEPEDRCRREGGGLVFTDEPITDLGLWPFCGKEGR